MRRALKILADREVSPQTGLLKSTLLQLDSTFSERNYGASSFLDFVEKLAQAGLVSLKHAGRSVMVELNEGVSDEATRRGRRAGGAARDAVAVDGLRRPSAAAPDGARPTGRADVAQMFRAAEDQAARYAAGGSGVAGDRRLPAQVGRQRRSGVQRAGQILAARDDARAGRCICAT